MTDTKVCSKCGGEFPLTHEYFHKNSHANNGYHSQCRLCREKQRKGEDIVIIAPIPPLSRKCYEIGYSQEQGRRYYQSHKEERKIFARRYQLSNKERIRRKALQWQRNNKEKVAATAARRRTRKLKAEGDYTSDHIQALYDFQEGQCFHCGVDISAYYEIDHWIPLSRGGNNWPENLRLLCKHCNRSKHDKLPWEWDNKYFEGSYNL